MGDKQAEKGDYHFNLENHLSNVHLKESILKLEIRPKNLCRDVTNSLGVGQGWNHRWSLPRLKRQTFI